MGKYKNSALQKMQKMASSKNRSNQAQNMGNRPMDSVSNDVAKSLENSANIVNEALNQGKSRGEIFEDIINMVKNGKNDIDFNTNHHDNYNRASDVEIDQPRNAEPVFKKGKKNDITFSLENLRDTQNFFKVTPDKFVEPDFSEMSVIEKKKKVFFESNFGKSYYNKLCWDEILDRIIKHFSSGGNKDPYRINQFGIVDGFLYAKKIQVDTSKFVDEELGISVYDLLEFHTLFDKLPGLNELVLDEIATEKFIVEYGPDEQGLMSMFKEARHLNKLTLEHSNGKDVITRADLANSQKVGSFKGGLTKAKSRKELKHASMGLKLKATNFKLPKGQAYSVSQETKKMRNHSFGIAAEAYSEDRPKLLKAAVFTTIGVALAGVNLISHVFNIGGGVINSIRGKN